jgi:broad specificity phosphatase PhoE
MEIFDLQALERWREMLEHPEIVQFRWVSLPEAQERCHALLEIRNLLDDHEYAACFNLGDVVRLGVLHTLGLPIQSIHQFQILPASVTAIAWIVR